MTVQQNDPTELLEVFDARGQPTGRAKSRASIHLDGDWHQAFHCWILRRNRDEIVLQRRSLAKEKGARSFANGLIDREYHQVYVLESDRPLTDYRPDPSEVVGLAAFRADAVLSLAAGNQAEMRATEAVRVLPDGTLQPDDVLVSRDELVPYSAARLRRTLGML